MNLAFGSREAATKGAWLQLKHPVSDEPLGVEEKKPVRWLIAGRDSDQFAKYQMQQQTIRVQEAARARGNWVPDPAKGVEEAISLLAACVLDWENTGFEEQESVPFSFDAARKIIQKEPWIGEQIAGWMNERANFFGASPRT